MLENYLVIVIVRDQKTFKLAINIKTVKEILFTSIVVLTVMAVLLSLSGVHVIAQETDVVMDAQNITGADSNNLTSDDNASEPEAGMISRKD
jgi:hypothetical protein